MDIDGNKRIFQRLGPPSSQQQKSTGPPGPHHQNNNGPKVCFHWRNGRCNRYPCPFLHHEVSSGPQQHHQNNNGISGSSKRAYAFNDESSSRGGGMRRNTNFNNTWGRNSNGTSSGGGVVKKTEKLCHNWVNKDGKCPYGVKCRYLHSWTTGDCFTLLTQLDGHEMVVTGITLPPGSDKLYSGSKDKTIRLWDCQSGQCAGVVNVDGEVGCILSEGPWIFVGLTNLVKAWNAQTGTDLSLNGPAGQVYALVIGNDMLLAGTEDGILAWKYNVSTNCFEPAAALKGHTHHVVSLVVGGNRLYSGSMDKTIRVWSLETMQCLQILTDHTDVVMSVLCWDQFLLSCSLDQTIKVWVANESGNLEVTYTHQEELGLLALCGMHDSEAKPVLLCSCNDNTIRVYDLPSFSERGKLFSKKAVRRIEIGPGGLFFTGDELGQVRVWQWITKPSSTA